MEHTLKASQSKHMEMAQQVGNELIDNFSGMEQFEFLEALKARIESKYKDRIMDCEESLKSVSRQYEDFKHGGDRPGENKNY